MHGSDTPNHDVSVVSDLRSTQPGIVVVVPRGEVVRNFVYTGAIDCLTEKSSVSLISVNTAFDSVNGATDRGEKVYPLKNIPESRFVEFVREIIDIAHGRWLWSRAAQHRWKVHNAEALAPWQKLVRFSKKCIASPFTSKKGLSVLSKIERKASRLFRTNEHYTDLFQRIRPDLVFNGSHVHSRNAIQVIQAAQWLGIKTATFIFSWDNLTSQGRVILPYDYYLVWNEDLKQKLLEMYDVIKADQVLVTGTPQFDLHFSEKLFRSRAEFCQEIGADADRPIVLYSTGMANHMPGEPEIVEEIADMLAELGGTRSPQLLVRVYAKDLTGRFDDLKARRADILFPTVSWDPEWLTPKADDSMALANTLRHCDLGINVASTISLELCMFDKPVINVGYNPWSARDHVVSYAEYYDFDHYKPVVDSGAVEVAWDRTQMRDLIAKALKEPGRLSLERRALLDRMFGNTLDGHSAKRVADVLLKLASNRA